MSESVGWHKLERQIYKLVKWAGTASKLNVIDSDYTRVMFALNAF